jgi:hydrogenase expression/formation protein HypC
MCVTAPGRVRDVANEMAVVEIDGRQRRASLLLVPDVAVGDWVIVAAGTVLEVLEPGEAAEILAMLNDAQPEEVG